jgi:hypothetical protein
MQKGTRFYKMSRHVRLTLFSPTKWFMSIYMPLMAKMAENNSFIMGFH